MRRALVAAAIVGALGLAWWVVAGGEQGETVQREVSPAMPAKTEAQPAVPPPAEPAKSANKTEELAVGGRILTETEAPVIGADVELMNREVVLRTVTDAEGRFRFEGLRAGWARVIVEAPGFLRKRPDAFEVDAGEEDLALRLRTRAPLMVSVEDGPEVERPVRVRITRLSMGPVRREALRKDMTAVSAARVERAFVLNAALPEEWVEETVPSNGRLWLYGLEARSEYAFSWGPSPGGLLAHRAGVKGDAGAVDLVPRPAVELAGTYRLETGTIPEGATVVAHGDGFEVTALQPEPGKFLVRGVPEEPILLVGRASTADGNEWAGFATAHGGGAPVELVLAPKRGAR